MVTINTKKLAIIMAALVGAGIRIDTLVSYLVGTVLRGESHDYGNFVAVEIEKVVNKMVSDPIGVSAGVAIDVTLIYAMFAILGKIITMAGGKKSIRIAKGITWRFA